MPTPAIIERMRELHTELGETQPTPATAEELARIKQQVDTVMLQPDHAPHYKGLSDRLLFAYVGFQIDHPKLAGLMQGVATSLSNAGI